MSLFIQDSPFYTPYINLLKNWYICKIDFSDPVKFFLCESKDTVPDYFVMPVFNLGGVQLGERFFDFTFFDKIDDTLRIELSIEEKHQKEYSLAKWLPGENSPFGGDIKTVEIKSGDFLLVRDVVSKKVWVYDKIKRANVILAVTGFYNSVISVENIKDPKVAFNFDLLFTDKFGNDTIRKAFFLHAKMNKIPGITVPEPEREKKEKVGFLKRLFK